ncbi:hypothetical protein Tco_1347157 [Tanacetum coccineum]
MGRDTIQLEDVVSTISGEYLLEFTSEYGIPEDLHPELPGPEDTIVDFPKGKVEMDLFNLISAPNPAKVKTGTRPRAAHEVPLLTATANRVIDMDTTGASGSSGTPSTVEKSPLDFADEDLPPPNTEGVGTEEQIQDELPAHSAYGGKSLATMGLGAGSISSTPSAQGAPTAAKSVSDPDPLSYAKPQPSSRGTTTEIPTEHVATTEVNVQLSVGSPESGKSTSVPSVVGSPGDIYQPGWGVTNDCRLDTPQHFLSQYNMNLARKVAMGSQLRLRFEQEELESLHVWFSDLQVNNNQLSQQVSNLQAQITGEEKIKAAFEEFKKYEDARVEQRCAEMDARLDALSIDFDEELYPHMLTAIAGRRWVIGHGIRLAVMKCAESTELRQVFANVVSAGIAKGMSEGLKYGIEHGKAGRDLVDVEAYDPEANDKLVKALQDLKDLKYPMVDQLERLKDAPMELIMASLHLEGDTGEDAPQRIRDLRPSSSQLKIPVYPEVRNPKDPWAVKEEMLLEDAIAANISRAEKKKKCRVVCRTHGIGFC